MGVETERKFLVELPNLCTILKLDGAVVCEITQTYLVPSDAERRIRMIICGGEVSYIYTEKRNVPGSSFSRFEDEREITLDEYQKLYREAISQLKKTRYAFPYAGHVVEIDVYPDDIGGELLRGRAILEVEMDSEGETILLPEFIHVISEVTGCKDYSNKKLAIKIKTGE